MFPRRIVEIFKFQYTFRNFHFTIYLLALIKKDRQGDDFISPSFGCIESDDFFYLWLSSFLEYRRHVICKAMNWYIYFKILQPIKLVELRVQLLNFFGMIKHYQI